MEQNKTAEREKELSRVLFKRRLITGILFAAFLITGVLFVFLREANKEVILCEIGFLTYETVVYNENYAVGIIIGLLGATVLGCVLLTDMIFCRYRTAEANGHCITVYRGITKCAVYINGQQTEGFGPLSLSNVVDAVLPDGTKIAVSFSRGALMVAHISFSDGNQPIDL